MQFKTLPFANIFSIVLFLKMESFKLLYYSLCKRTQRVIELISRMLIQLLISIDHNAREGLNESRSERDKHFDYRLSPAIIRFSSTSLSVSLYFSHIIDMKRVV